MRKLILVLAMLGAGCAGAHRPAPRPRLTEHARHLPPLPGHPH